MRAVGYFRRTMRSKLTSVWANETDSLQRSRSGMQSTSLSPAGWHSTNAANSTACPSFLGQHCLITRLRYNADHRSEHQKSKGGFSDQYLGVHGFKRSKPVRHWACQHLNFKLLNLLWTRVQLFSTGWVPCEKITLSQILQWALLVTFLFVAAPTNTPRSRESMWNRTMKYKAFRTFSGSMWEANFSHLL